MLGRLALTPVPFACLAFAVAAGASSLIPSPSLIAREDADKILEQADKVRVPGEEYTVRAKLDGAAQPIEIVQKKDRPSAFLRNPAFFSGGEGVSDPQTSLMPWKKTHKARFERADRKETQLLLVPRKKENAEDRIRLWVATGSLRPLRAEWLAKDGTQVVKRAYFENYKEMAGAPRPSLIRLEDSSGKKSELAILSIEVPKTSLQ